MIRFKRNQVSDLPEAKRREWLVTNGIGGFGMGTISGTLTRRYHGLLIAALEPPLGRTLLVTKLDETAKYGKEDFPLFNNSWAGGLDESNGLHYLEGFHLEGTTPVWTFSFADARLEKRVWMQHGANTTYIMYTLCHATRPLSINAKALVNYRDYHSTTQSQGWEMKISREKNGLKVLAYDRATAFYLATSRGSFAAQHIWIKKFYLSIEAYRGQGVFDDHLFAGLFSFVLEPGQSICLVASTEIEVELDGSAAYLERRKYEEQLLVQAPILKGQSELIGNGDNDRKAIQQLVLAADQFVVRRRIQDEIDGWSIIAGYPWFGDWGRDTMIAFPGLVLSTGRSALGAQILRTYARFIDRGMLPNRFPDRGTEPEYNTVDATLWYFEAVGEYYRDTRDDNLLRDLYPGLQQIIERHLHGTRYNIRQDPDDGLIYAGRRGVQLTWMDAKVEDWVVTPRIGKPVEINALWYNALCTMAAFTRQLGLDDACYNEMAERTHLGFDRFWSEKDGYCYDVLDGPEGNDDALRPNQLIAVSLTHSPIDERKAKAVVEACADHLATSFGLRSLSPEHPSYKGVYGGDQKKRDSAYHQGTVWGWLIGPFAKAHLRVFRDPEMTRALIMPLLQHLNDHGVGSVSEIFDGDSPHTPRGCPAQAWSVAELLRVCRMIS